MQMIALECLGRLVLACVRMNTYCTYGEKGGHGIYFGKELLLQI